ncbi:LuxR C-terminal-related transcriptional regulator [Streptomyces sp. NPDC048290]|uniref:helix-turn-helix transcriptional regulator n=1 Tax=Streptomyces sp. NPDC048290 TaxID=3155811 RepID=UPI003430AD6E
MKIERDAHMLELPWPFTGRAGELELVRRSLAAGRHGIVVTGPAGCGKTRLATEALRGTGCAKVSGTPGTHRIPFAAFAHLLPEPVSLHRAVQLLSGVRLLLVDDAHLLDDSSAALVHHLAVHGRTRLVVVARDTGPLPGAVSRLWTGEVLPRLALEPLPDDDLADLLTAGTGGRLEPLTMNRLRRLAAGDLRLLRDLSAALGEHALLTPVPGTPTAAWRGPVPLTETVRLRAAAVLGRTDPTDRETLDRLAFTDPLAPHLDDDFDLPSLERLEADGLVTISPSGEVTLAHPLYGPVLRAAAGTLRTRRLTRTPDEYTAALKSESAALEDRLQAADVRPVPLPVGDWLLAETAAVPADYAALRARYDRLRGALREAASWAREGLRTTPDDALCHRELSLSTTQLGEPHPGSFVVGSGDGTGAVAGVAGSGSPVVGSGDGTGAAVGEPHMRPGDCEGAAAVGVACSGSPVVGSGDRSGAAVGEPCPGPSATPPGGRIGTAVDGPYEDWTAAYDAVRRGVAPPADGSLPPGSPFARHAEALARADGPALDRAAALLEARGFLLFAAEAHAQAVAAHRDPSAARLSRTRAITLARRCQGARTPALAGLALGELTARQRQIVTLAAAGLSNREIADRLTLSIRTVGNHLYGAYTRLGASDRGALPRLTDLPGTRSA